MSARQRPRPTPSALVRAAGAVVWRFRPGYAGVQPRIGQIINPDDIEVLIVHRPRYNDWSWPKGKTESGELVAAAAVREVEEETGEVIMLGAPLTIQRYRLGSGHTKEVHYWVGRQAAGNPAARVRPPVVRAPRKEIDDCRWVSVPEAHSMLTRRGDRRLLTEVTTLAESGALVTAPLLVMRPAETVERERWEGILAERHLTRVGVRQSVDVIDTLSAFCVQSIHTSEWLCAYRSVAPYASVAGLPVNTHPELTEPSVMADPSRAVSLLCGLVDHLESATLVSANRAVLPHLMEALRRQALVDVRPSFPTEEPWLRPAELLVAHVGISLGGVSAGASSGGMSAGSASGGVSAGAMLAGGASVGASSGGMTAGGVSGGAPTLEVSTQIVDVVPPAPAERKPLPVPSPHVVFAASKRAQRAQRAEAPAVKVCTAPRQIVAVERHTVPGTAPYSPL